jgi:hypothetical protein
MVATREAAMECFRRAALAEQTFVGRELGLRYGDRLVRSFAALTDALNRATFERCECFDGCVYGPLSAD